MIPQYTLLVCQCSWNDVGACYFALGFRTDLWLYSPSVFFAYYNHAWLYFHSIVFIDLLLKITVADFFFFFFLVFFQNVDSRNFFPVADFLILIIFLAFLSVFFNFTKPHLQPRFFLSNVGEKICLLQAWNKKIIHEEFAWKNNYNC